MLDSGEGGGKKGGDNGSPTKPIQLAIAAVIVVMEKLGGSISK